MFNPIHILYNIIIAEEGTGAKSNSKGSIDQVAQRKGYP